MSSPDRTGHATDRKEALTIQTAGGHSAVPPSAYAPPWIAIVALVVSILTLFKTVFGDWRARRLRQATKFEADFGTPIRTGLRVYEKAISTLRVYALGSAKSLDDLKKEIEAERPKWLDAVYEITHLLQEADDSDSLFDTGWAARFEPFSVRAEAHMLAMTDATTATLPDLQNLARLAQQELNAGIGTIRAELRAELQSYDKI